MAEARRWSWRRKLLLQLALLPAWLLVAEIVLRVALWIGGHPYHAAETHTAISAVVTGMTELAARPETKREEVDAATLGFYNVWHAHPYFGTEDYTQPRLPSREYRALSVPGKPEEYKILLLGGSVAWMMEREGTDALEKLLLADARFAGRTIRFINYARPALKEPQQVMQLAYLLEFGVRPDAVIDLDGFNECALAWTNIEHGANPIYPDIGIWGHAVASDPNDRRALDLLLDIRELQNEVASIADFALCWQFEESSILGRLTLARLSSRSVRAAAARKDYVEHLLAQDKKSALLGPVIDGGEEAAQALCVRIWLEASRSMQDLCRARSIYYVHVLQPTRHDTGSKPLAPEELASGGNNSNFIDSVHALYPRLREAGKELRSLGVNFLDASMAFAELKEPVYYDHCHFNRPGKELLAARIAEFFLAGMPAPR